MKKRMYLKRDGSGIELLTKRNCCIRWFCWGSFKRFVPDIPINKRIPIDLELIPITYEERKDYQIYLSESLLGGGWKLYSPRKFIAWLFSYTKDLTNYFPRIKKSEYYGVIIHY